MLGSLNQNYLFHSGLVLLLNLKEEPTFIQQKPAGIQHGYEQLQRGILSFIANRSDVDFQFK